MISIIVPVYDSAPTLAALWTRIVSTMDSAERPFEGVFVNDASGDNSQEILQSLALRDHRVRVLAHAFNAGQGAAIRTGIAHARGLALVTLDDDLQHRPEDIPDLLRLLAGNPRALVMAVPVTRSRPWWREVASAMCHALSNVLLAKPLPLRLTTFCAFHKGLGEELLQPSARRSAAWITLLAQAAERTLTCSVTMDASALARSRYTPRTLFALFRSRSRLFALRRVLALTAAALLAGISMAAMSLQAGPASGAVALATLAGVATATAAITIGLATLSLVERLKPPPRQPEILVVAGDDLFAG